MGGYTMAEVAKAVGDIPAGVTDASQISPQLRSDPEAIDGDVQRLKLDMESLFTRLTALEEHVHVMFLDASEHADEGGVPDTPSRLDRLENIIKRHLGEIF